MVTPVTGPFVEIINTTSNQKRKVWYRQKRPYDRVLAFDYSNVIGPFRGSEISYDAGDVASYVTAVRNLPDWTNLRNQAYARFKGKLSPTDLENNFNTGSAGGLVNIAQLNQSLEMIGGRAIQLRRFFQSLRKGDFSQAIEWAKQTYAPSRTVLVKPPKGRPERVVDKDKYGPARNAANLWLEWSFGWAPMLNDIQTSSKILGAPGPSSRLHGSAKESKSVMNVVSFDQGLYPGYRNEHRISSTFDMRVRMGGDVRVTNPNLYLYNQLGLANPLPAVWDVIPWSFVVDWVTNMSDFLNSGSDLWGLSLERAYTSCKIKGTNQCQKIVLDTRVKPAYGYTGSVSYDYASVIREVGLSTPVLAIRPVWITSWKRAANAVSLLTQFLPRK